jgi:hypothetical protein
MSSVQWRIEKELKWVPVSIQCNNKWEVEYIEILKKVLETVLLKSGLKFAKQIVMSVSILVRFVEKLTQRLTNAKNLQGEAV